MAANTQSIEFSQISKNPETLGFDLQAGETWIYPTNYPTRDYQFNIIQKALLQNTLVSLPTGLGKTFIAAVVMYNFYRWYPQGKIIFMAPTRPLVKQQVDACYNIMAIPPETTAELTGTKVSSSRSDVWIEKRVFFVTPQVLQNDLEKVAQLGPKIKCLVFDEAHRARGNHAYCQVIRKLLQNDNKHFRVLALSATPGSNIGDVSEVIHSLLISHLEFRTEESIDVQPYVFQRSLETVVVPLDDKIQEVKEQYIGILDHYARTLVKFNVIQGNICSLTKGKIFMVMKEFQNKNRGGSNSANYGEIMRCLNICVTLYHAFELLIRHGLRNFLSFYDEHIEKPLLRNNHQLRQILEDVRAHLGPIPNIVALPDGTYPEVPKNIKFGHPKHYKLQEILVRHFSEKVGDSTRVIVFFEYRESVMEAHTLLLQSRPLIRPKIFLGQKCGVTQKIQLGVVKAFKEGKCNTLLSTCIGEEGLDVGEVDLIVCFDISNKSPIRMVQRMGRTGRKRAGSVIILVTEGKEQQTLKDCLIHKNNISAHVLGSKQIHNDLYPYNPRLVPGNIHPKCEKMFITVKKNETIIDKLKRASKSSSSDLIFTQSSEVCDDFRDSIPEPIMMILSDDPLKKTNKSKIFSKHIEKLRSKRKTGQIGHSSDTNLLNNLLSFADSKRFNIPISTQGNPAKSLRQGDIRSMLLGSSQNSQSVFESQTPKPLSLTSTQESDKFEEVYNAAVEEALNIIQNMPSPEAKCNFCTDCDKFILHKNYTNKMLISIPAEATVDSVTLDNIEDLLRKLNGEEEITLNCSSFDNDLDSNECSKLFTFEPPKNFQNLMDYSNIEEEISDKSLLEFFKLDSWSDIFEDFHLLSPVLNTSTDRSKFKRCSISSQKSEKDLQALCDFAILQKDKSSILQTTPNNSPSKEDLDELCDFSFLTKNNVPTSDDQRARSESDESFSYSPILADVSRGNKDNVPDSDFKIENTKKSCTDLQKSIGKTYDDIDELCDLSFLKTNNGKLRKSSPKERSQVSKTLLQENDDSDELEELCDLSHFRLTGRNSTKSSPEKSSDTDLDDLCDLSYFNLKNSNKSEEDLECTQLVPRPDSPPLRTNFHLNKSQKFTPDKIDIASPESPSLLAHSEPLESLFKKPLKANRKVSQDTNVTITQVLQMVDKPHILNLSDDDDFEEPPSFKKPPSTVKKKKPIKNVEQFLDLEAELSGDEVSEDEEAVPDVYEKSFVNDETQNICTQMHAVYLQSVRSPTKKKVQKLPPVNISEIYSQLPPMEESEYMEDSFCVDESEDEPQCDEYSVLEMLEKKLKERKKRKRKEAEGITKRRRIKVTSSDSE